MTLHERIADELRRRVLAGVYAPGERLPALWRIAKDFGVSEPVVSMAVRELRRSGLVRSVPGRGVWVADAITDAGRMQTALDMLRCGEVPEDWGADTATDGGREFVPFPVVWIQRLLDENASLARRLVAVRVEGVAAQLG